MALTSLQRRRQSCATEARSCTTSPSIPALSALEHTPVWVWALLTAILAVGVRQAFPRSVTMRHSMVPPLAMLALSLWGFASTFGSKVALAALGALGAWGPAAAAASLQADVPRGARRSAAGQVFHVPGSWVLLVLMHGIFCTRFGVGVSLALQPELRGATRLASAASLAYGVFSGIFAGRKLALWRLACQPLQASAA